MKTLGKGMITCILSILPLLSYANIQEANINAGNFVTQALSSKTIGVGQIFEKPKEEVNVEKVQDTLNEFKIKKELNEKLLTEIKTDMQAIEEKIQSNQGDLATLSGSKDGSIELTDKYNTLQKENQQLKQEVFFKESLISDLKNSIENYKLLEIKYENVLNQYVQVQKGNEQKLGDSQNEKYLILLLGLAGFLFFYFLKIFIKKKNIFKKEKDNFLAYYDLIYAISLVIFIITYLFYLFPQLYILLVFVSGSIIWANAILISSFVSSLIIFRKFAIGDIIGIGNDIGKIVKITPLHTTIRKINEHGIIEGDEMSIPNINLIKDSINVINDINVKDHYFSIILSLKSDENLFQIVDEIQKDILQKYLTHQPHSINPLDEDIYKMKYEHLDSENIKVTFFWKGPDNLNRKIEKMILLYVKGVVFDSMERRSILKKIGLN